MIAKDLARFARRPNLVDYAAVRAAFNWEKARALLDGLPGGRELNIGALKAKSVVSTLFSAFGPEPIATRLGIGEGQVLVTTEALYRRKVEALRDRLPKLAHVILIDEGTPIAGTLRWRDAMAGASDRFVIPPTAPEDMALLHFTSGTTGRPKGAIHVHDAVVTHHATGLYALDLHDDDIFWCTADPGWVTGTSYGIIAPLTLGVTNLIVEAEFKPPRVSRRRFGLSQAAMAGCSSIA